VSEEYEQSINPPGEVGRECPAPNCGDWIEPGATTCGSDPCEAWEAEQRLTTYGIVVSVDDGQQITHYQLQAVPPGTPLPTARDDEVVAARCTITIAEGGVNSTGTLPDDLYIIIADSLTDGEPTFRVREYDPALADMGWVEVGQMKNQTQTITYCLKRVLANGGGIVLCYGWEPQQSRYDLLYYLAFDEAETYVRISEI